MNINWLVQLSFQFICNAQLFSRICGRNSNLLEVTSQFAEKAASIDSTSSVAMAEVGRQCLLRGKIKEAQKFYKVIDIFSIYVEIFYLQFKKNNLKVLKFSFLYLS